MFNRCRKIVVIAAPIPAEMMHKVHTANGLAIRTPAPSRGVQA